MIRRDPVLVPGLQDWQTFFLHLAEQFGLPTTVAAAITLLTIIIGWLTLPASVARIVGRSVGALDTAGRRRLGSRRHAALRLLLACIQLPLAVAGILKVVSVIAEYVRDSMPSGGTTPFEAVRYFPSLVRWTVDDRWIGTSVAVLSLLLATFLVAQVDAPSAAKFLQLVVGYPLGLALQGAGWVAGITVAIEIVMTLAHLAGASPQVLPLLLAITGLAIMGDRTLGPIDDGIASVAAGRRPDGPSVAV